MLNFKDVEDLREFTYFYINEHDHLSKEERKTLYDFALEASTDQLKYLLLTGEMKKHLTKTEISEIGTWGVSAGSHPWASPGGVQVGAGRGVVGLAAAAALALAARTAYRAYKDKINKLTRRCSHIKHGTPERRKCETKAKIEATTAKIKSLVDTGKKLCPKSKDPKKCQEKIEKKKITMQNKINSLKAKI
jgi:hypothetical protein